MGHKVILWRQLARALGPSTWRLWTALLTLRDATGETHATTKTIAQVAQLSERGAKKSLARLRKAKLIDDLGWMWKHVPCSCPADEGPHDHEVYVRRVFGGMQNREGALSEEPMVRVPAEVEQWTLRAPGCGGRRKGAGRPEGSKDQAPRQPRKREIRGVRQQSKGSTYKNQEEEAEERAYALSSTSSPRGARHEGLSVRAGRGAGMNAVQRAVAVAVGSAPVLTVVSEPASVGPASVEAAAGEEGGQPWDWSAELADQPAKVHQPQRYTSEDQRAIPSTSSLPLAVIPGAPQLMVGMSEDDQLRMLTQAYATAHERVFGKRPYMSGLVRRCDPRKWLPAVEVLEALGLPPLSWAVFMMREVWLGKLGKKGAPRPHFVWDVTKVAPWARWCLSSVGKLHTGTLVWTPAARAYLEKTDALRKALGRGEDTQAVVARVFSESEQRALYARVVREADEARDEIDRLLSSGEWLWRGM